MRSPSCNVVPGQLGWKGSDQFYEDNSLLDDDHWERQQGGRSWILDLFDFRLPRMAASDFKTHFLLTFF
ncbi:unnamed protein product [Caenorhabditis nigoni]